MPKSHDVKYCMFTIFFKLIRICWKQQKASTLRETFWLRRSRAEWPTPSTGLFCEICGESYKLIQEDVDLFTSSRALTDMMNKTMKITGNKLQVHIIL